MHRVSKEDWGLVVAWAVLRPSVHMSSESPIAAREPSSSTRGFLHLQKLTSAWMMRARWLNFALSVRSVCFEGILDLAACLSS
jgi:hypothetical protein